MSRLLRIDTVLYIVYAFCAALPLLWQFYLILGSKIPIEQDVQVGPAGFTFPCLLLSQLALVQAVLKPVAYMMWPPTAGEWKELVYADEDGVKRPKKSPPSEATGLMWFAEVLFNTLLISSCLR